MRHVDRSSSLIPQKHSEGSAYLHDKNYGDVRIGGIYSKIIKTVPKHIVHFLLSGDKQFFPLKSRMRQGCPLCTLLSDVVLAVRAIARERIKGRKIGGSQTVPICRWCDCTLRTSYQVY